MTDKKFSFGDFFFEEKTILFCAADAKNKLAKLFLKESPLDLSV
jgi:hypothetical protein